MITKPDVLADHRVNNFDFLRFLFASLVLFYHSFALLLGPGHRSVYPGEGLAGMAGGSSVNFFFVISGFLVTASWMRVPSFRPYLEKRILRIYPAFILVMAFCAFVAGPLGTDSVSLYWHHFKAAKALLYLFMLPADVVGPDMALMFPRQGYPEVIDGSCWTLRYEFGMYLLVAALGTTGLYRVWRSRGVLTLFSLMFCLFAAAQVSRHSLLPSRSVAFIGDLSQWLRLSTFFLSGMVFYFYRRFVPLSSTFLGVSLAVLVGTASRVSWFNALLPLFGSYLLFFVAFSPRIKLHDFARYGDFSYGIYLFSFPIQQLLIRYFGPELNPYWLFLAAFPVSLLCAALSWHCVEKPCLRLKTRMLKTWMLKPALK